MKKTICTIMVTVFAAVLATTALAADKTATAQPAATQPAATQPAATQPAAKAAPMTANLQVVEGVICKNVVNRAPVDPGNTFPKDVGKLFCFTRVIGATGPTSITHQWYYNDRQVASVVLPVKSPNWRTRSSKVIVPWAAGAWRVDVLGPDGKLLKSLAFTIQ